MGPGGEEKGKRQMFLCICRLCFILSIPPEKRLYTLKKAFSTVI